MRLDFKKFKKVKSDAKSTTLKHADGHMIVIAHDNLNPKLKGELHALPTFAEGGKIPGGDGSPAVDQEAAKEIQKGATKSGVDPDTWIKNIKEGVGLADGGEVAEMPQQPEAPDEDFVRVPKELLQRHIGQLQPGDSQDENMKSYNPLDTLSDLAKIAGINIQRSMDADTTLMHENPDAWRMKSAGNIAMGSMGKVASTEAAVGNAAKPANFTQRAAAEQAEDAASRVKAGKFNAEEANDLYKGVQDASKVKAKVDSRIQNAKDLKKTQGLADGGEVIDVSDAGQAPAVDPIAMADPNTIPGEVATAMPPEVAQAPQMSPASAVPPLPQPNQPVQSPQAPGAMPTAAGGYEAQIKGIEQEAAARGDLGKAQAEILKNAQEVQQKQIEQFNTHYAELEKERVAHMADIKAGFVNPDKYWDDHSKLAAGLGIILAGFSPKANGGNAALEFVNSNINRSIQAQAQNLQAQHNLLSANLHQFGNMRDATAMTRTMMTDIMKDKLDQAAAVATSPLAKANALRLKGQLQMQAAPEFLQLAMRRSLMAGNQQQGNGAQQFSHQDPAAYVPYVVPKEERKDAFHAIKQADDARQNQDEIIKQFNIAASSPLKSIGVGEGAAAAKRMEALFLPMIHDQEGRVNEYEQATLQKLMPTTGDTAKTLDSKRAGLRSFINNKMSAPQLRGYGIDLERFQSTSRSPEASLNPQQQAFVQWARQNPGPKADMVLKKLGVK